MSDAERALYEDVTDYLMRPQLHAFSGRMRKLLLIGFHRRMASSNAALAASLDHVARRLHALLAGLPVDEVDAELRRDLDDDEDDEDGGGGDGDGDGNGDGDANFVYRVSGVVSAGAEGNGNGNGNGPIDSAGLAAEHALIEHFARRARALPSDAKARAFQEAIRLIVDRGRDGTGSGKAVVFTESITTQDYLKKLLCESGLAEEEVTLFRGTNDSERARAALARWRTEEGATLRALPSRDVQVRLALLHEFRTRSRVLVSTEAGAKGLNLQFCETVINYDLPWNPQKIEQRIGRCHRYGQTRDVTVVNFLSRDNEAHRLTFEILSRKLDLFGRVLDASDAVLHEPREGAPEPVVGALSADFERELRRIYDRGRTVADVTRDLVKLRDEIGERRTAYDAQRRRTAALIESRFDEDVKRVFRGLRGELSAGLERLDHDLAVIVCGHLDGLGASYRRSEEAGRVVIEVEESAALAGPGRRFATGDAKGLTGAEPLNRVHPLVIEALRSARAYSGGEVLLDAPSPS
ncbi:MAG: hypothetical protein EXR72_03730 [Myxococcales bacterium]|nr:hypothetical protein [Myxococcales bacterium]